MSPLQISFILIFGMLSLIVSLKGWLESTQNQNAFGDTWFLFWLGIFVWGDALIWGPFWVVVSLLSLLVQNIWFTLLLVSLFWLVRSVGETSYWLNQQFSPIKRNPPETMRGYQFVKNDSIWFIYQIFWQAISVLTLLTSIFCAWKWLVSF